MANAVVSQNTASTFTIVAAPGVGKFIRVFGYTLVSAGAQTAKWQDASGPTDLTGAMTLATGNPVDTDFNPNGWFDLAQNAALSLVLTAAIQVSGHVSYQVIG